MAHLSYVDILRSGIRKRFVLYALCGLSIITADALGRGTIECRNDYQSGCEKTEENPVASRLTAQEIIQLLPVDHVDLVYVAIMDIVRSPSYYKENKIDLFLSVFREDPADALLKKLASMGLDFRSGLMRYGGTLSPPGQRYYSVAVSNAEHLGGNIFLVIVDYYCDGWCGGSTEYTIKFDGKTFEIIGRAGEQS